MLRVYLDMCCFNRPYDDQSQLKVAMETQCKLHIQNLIIERKLEICHVASAIYAKCSYFISTDKRLLKYQTNEIKMVTPIEFVTETEAD